ncbi:helix-turn-helix domain-containing protein [Umezawaea sp. NPDC059074]|uniref:helix-turn-helix domain-containing protein n=1 Tax=Umezawaea sp. NPDC059074 TaxID=3346716 RepID=UPI0036B244C4
MNRTAPLEVISASLRRERARVGLSLSELAKKAGVAKSTLSQLESGSGNPSVETLWALATVLDIPLSKLVDPPTARVLVIRAGEGPAIYSERAHYTATLLASCPPGARRDLYQVALEPGAGRESQPHRTGTVEHLVVGSGRLLAGPADGPVELGVGDYLTYPGDVPHTCRALEPGSVGIMLMEYL